MSQICIEIPEIGSISDIITAVMAVAAVFVAVRALRTWKHQLLAQSAKELGDMAIKSASKWQTMTVVIERNIRAKIGGFNGDEDESNYIDRLILAAADAWVGLEEVRMLAQAKGGRWKKLVREIDSAHDYFVEFQTLIRDNKYTINNDDDDKVKFCLSKIAHSAYSISRVANKISTP